MADKVGLKEQEYTSLRNKLSEAHSNSLNEVKDTLEKLESLNTEAGGFQTIDMSSKIGMLVGAVNSISSRMSEVYTAHETIVESFLTAIENYDTD